MCIRDSLDAVIEYMPSPLDIPAIKGTDLEGNEIVRESSDDEPFSALVFKIMTDPFVGKLAYFRVYSGTLNSGSYVLNATKGKKERVGRILQMHANKRQELDKVYSGDIAAAIGFKFSGTGDTICDDQHPVILESMEFPEPVIDIAIEPKTKAGQQKMGEALAKLAEEDPKMCIRDSTGGGQLHDAFHAADDRERVYDTGNDQNSNCNPFGAFYVEQAGSCLAHQRGGQTEGGGSSG